jgi:hypothetical protein
MDSQRNFGYDLDKRIGLWDAIRKEIIYESRMKIFSINDARFSVFIIMIECLLFTVMKNK